MPIFVTSKKIIHFAHIPKTGGTSVEKYILSTRITRHAFLDCSFATHRAQSPWNNSSPQHIDGASLRRLFPSNFFTDFFAILRDPINRFISAYLFQMDEPGSKLRQISVNEFIATYLEASFKRNGWCDNHFLPQKRFLHPEGNYNLFYLNSEGMKKVKAYLDELLEIPENFTQIPQVMQSDKQSSIDLKADLTSESINRLKIIYKEDYGIIKSLTHDEP